jgi:hypothetical protein
MQDAGHLEKTGTNVETQVVVGGWCDSRQTAVHAQKLPHAWNAFRHAAIYFCEPIVFGRLGDQMPHEKQS